jgi:hypothetical protein
MEWWIDWNDGVMECREAVKDHSPGLEAWGLAHLCNAPCSGARRTPTFWFIGKILRRAGKNIQSGALAGRFPWEPNPGLKAWATIGNRFAVLHPSATPSLHQPTPVARCRCIPPYSNTRASAPLESCARVSQRMIVVFVGAPRGSRDWFWFGGLWWRGKQACFGRDLMVGNGLLSERHIQRTAVSTAGFVHHGRALVRQFETAVRRGADCGLQRPAIVFNSN